MPSEVELERMVIRLIGDGSKYEKMLQNAERQTFAWQRRLGQSLNQIGGGISSLGRKMTLTLTVPLTAMAAVSVKAFADFDQAMTQSTSIMDATGQQVEQMRDLALSLGQQGIQGPEELAKSYFFLASAGFDAEQSMAGLPIVQRFATAGAFDMAKATDLLTDAQSALGLNVGTTMNRMMQMSRVSDVLVRANTLANATVEQFSTALTTKAGASLKAFNKDVEEGVAVLAAMADQGIKAELAGNSLSRFMLLLSKAALDNKEAFEKYGFSVFDASGKMRNMADIVENLETSLAGLSDEEKAAALSALGFEARIQGAILPLLGTSDAIRRYEKELRTAFGTSNTVAQKQQRSFTNQMKLLKNQVMAAAIEVGRTLVPVLVILTGALKSGLDMWNSWSTTTRVAILVVAAMVAAIGPLLVVLGTMIVVIGNLSLTIHLLNTNLVAARMAMIAFKATAIALKVAILAGVATAVVALVGHISGLTQALLELHKQMRRADELNKQMARSQQNATKEFVHGTQELSRPERIKALEEEIKRHKENLKVQVQRANAHAKQGQVLNNQGIVGRGISLASGELQAKAQETKDAQAVVAATKQRIEMLQQVLAQTKATTGELTNQEQIAKALEEVEQRRAESAKLTQSLQDQVDLFGLSATEAQIYALEMKGATDELDRARELQAKLNELQKQADISNSVSDVNRRYEEQIHLFGLTNREAELYKLRMMGATEADIAHVQEKAKMLDKLEAEQRALDESKKKAEELARRGEQIAKQFRTPQEVLRDTVAELDKLKEAKAIDETTYSRALEAAKKEAQDATKEVKKLKAELGDVEGVRAGTAQFRQAVRQTQALNAGRPASPAAGGIAATPATVQAGRPSAFDRASPADPDNSRPEVGLMEKMVGVLEEIRDKEGPEVGGVS